MYCVSDPNLNSDTPYYTDKFPSRPLSCPNCVCSFEHLFHSFNNSPEKEKNNFNLNLEWHEVTRNYDHKNEYPKNHDKVIKNSKSADNLLEIVYYQTCSQTSCGDYPFFQNKEAFRADSPQMMLIYSSPEADQGGMEYKKHQNPLEAWMETDHRNKHNNEKCQNCAINEWFQQEELLTYQQSTSHLGAYTDCHQCDTHSHKGSKMTDNGKHKNCLPCFHQNCVCSSFFKKPLQCCRKTIRNNDDFVPFFRRDLDKHRLQDKAPCCCCSFNDPCGCPCKCCRCSRYKHNTQCPFFDYPLSHKEQLYNPCFCNQKLSKPFKAKDCCLESDCCRSSESLDSKAKKCMSSKGQGGAKKRLKQQKRKETWTTKYRNYIKKREYQKMGLCFKCGEVLSMSKKGCMWKKRSTSFVARRRTRKSRHLCVNVENGSSVEKNSTQKEKMVTNICDDQKNFVKNFQSPFEVIYPLPTSDMCSQTLPYSNVEYFCDNSYVPQDGSYMHMQDGKGKDYMQDDHRRYYCWDYGPYSNCMSTKPKRNTTLPAQDAFNAYCDKAGYFDNSAKDAAHFDDSAVNNMLNACMHKMCSSHRFHGMQCPCKCHYGASVNSHLNHRAPLNKHYYRGPIIDELNYIEEETKNLEKKLKKALQKKKSLNNSLQQESMQEHDEEEEFIKQCSCDKGYKNLNEDIANFYPDVYNPQEVQQVDNKNFKKARSKSLKFGRKKSPGKVEKIANDFEDGRVFLKDGSDKQPMRQDPLKVQNKKNFLPQKFVIQKPNFKEVISKQVSKENSYVQTIQHNNHPHHSSLHSFHDNTTDSFHREEFLLQKQHLPANNFCNHSHNFSPSFVPPSFIPPSFVPPTYMPSTFIPPSIMLPPFFHHETSFFNKGFYRDNSVLCEGMLPDQESNYNHHCKVNYEESEKFAHFRERLSQLQRQADIQVGIHPDIQVGIHPDMQAEQKLGIPTSVLANVSTDEHWKELFVGHYKQD